jgi:Transposase IS4
MFPPKQLRDMVHWTNIELSNYLELKQTSSSELLKLFGILILMTKFEFTSRASFWLTMAWSMYQPTPQFGLTGMSKHMFEDLEFGGAISLTSLLWWGLHLSNIDGSWLTIL